MSSKKPQKRKTPKRLFAGRKYYIMSFDSGRAMVMYGDLVKHGDNGQINHYTFSAPDKGFYKIFTREDMKKAKTGQAVRKSIRNGRLEFIAFFETGSEALASMDKLPKKVAYLLIMESIESDKQTIMKIKESVMDRISVLKDVASSKTMSDLNSAVKKAKFYS